jgi:hypothetical protein
MNKYCKIYLDALVKTARPGDTPEYGSPINLDDKYEAQAKAELDSRLKESPNIISGPTSKVPTTFGSILKKQYKKLRDYPWSSALIPR